MPPFELGVAARLHLKKSVLAGGPALPSRADRIQSSLTEKNIQSSYAVSPCSERLLAYQAKLEEQVTTSSDAALWDEVCLITIHCLQMNKVEIQALVRTMGLMVLQERARWLNLTTLST